MTQQTVTVNLNDLMPVGSAAKALGMSRMTIYRWLGGGKIIGIKLGGILFIPRSEIERIKNKVAVAYKATAKG